MKDSHSAREIEHLIINPEIYKLIQEFGNARSMILNGMEDLVSPNSIYESEISIRNLFISARLKMVDNK